MRLCFDDFVTAGAASSGAIQRTIALTCAVSALWAFVASPAVRAADPVDEYKLAVGLYNRNQWQLAAERFQSFVDKNPKHPKAENARYYLGLTYYNLDNFKQARDTLRSYLKDYPQGMNALAAGCWIGQCSFLIDDFPAAEAELSAYLQAFKSAGADDPANLLQERALAYLGDVELRLKKPEPAAQHFQLALKLYAQGAMSEDCRFGLARAYEQTGRSAEAVALYRELAAVKTGAHAAEAQFSLGLRFFDDANYAAAIAAFSELDKQFPASAQAPLARLNQGLAQYQLGQFRQAITLFEKAAESPPHAAEAALWKGLCLKSLAEFPQAAAAFHAAFDKFSSQPQAESLLYQWADCELRRGAYDEARKLFLDLVARWPKGALADAALHAACLAALYGGQLDEADTLATRFDREFTGNKFRFRQEILKGRLRLARNDAAGAIKLLEKVAAESDVAATRVEAGYYLAAAAQKLGQHGQVLQITQPLANQVAGDKALAEFAGVFVIRAASALALGNAAAREKPQDKPAWLAQYATAAAAAQKYAVLLPNGDLADQALALEALAAAHMGNKQHAQDQLQVLRQRYPNSPELDRTRFELGQVAFSNEDWEWAGTLFGELTALPKETRYHARAQWELGWTEYKRRHFTEAAAQFAALIAQHPDDKQVAEAAFMQGTALQDAGKQPEALVVFTEAFKRYGGSDSAWLAGLQRARLLARAKRAADADAAYAELLQRFPQRPDADKLLDEWATVNYDAGRFARSDELFARLIREHPQSELADNAQFSLAESLLVGGKPDDARAQFTALSVSPQSDAAVQQRALYQLMRIAAESRRWDELRKTSQESLRRFPEGTWRAEADFYWAEADLQTAAYKEAQERLLKLKLQKDQPEVGRSAWFARVWVLLAETQFRLKQYGEVAATLAELKQYAPQSPLLYQVEEILGRSLKAQALFAEARAAFERVVSDRAGELTETAAKSQFEIAETYVLEKNYKAALLEYLKVDIRYKYPEWQAPALYQAGVCHEALSEWKAAQQTYQNLLRDYPMSELAPKARERLEVIRKRAAG